MSYGIKNYPVSASSEEIPFSISSSSNKRPLPSSVRTVSIASSSATQNAGGSIQFQIPTAGSNAYLRPGSMYLKCTIEVTNVGGFWDFQGPTHSASSCIQTLSVYLGNQLVEQKQNYNIWHDKMLIHGATRGYVTGDSAILEDTSIARSQKVPGMAAAVNVTIPVLANVFNGSKALPLWALNSPILVEFTLAALNAAIASDTALASAYTVRNMQLIYDTIQVSPEYITAMKQAMNDPANPKLYQMDVLQTLNGKFPVNQATDVSFNVGTNMSSVRGILYTLSVDPAGVIGANGDRVFTSQIAVADDGKASNDFNVLLDGNKQLSFVQDSHAVSFAEAQKVFGSLFDPNINYPYGEDLATAAGATSTAWSNFRTNYFVGGVNTTRFYDENLAMKGSPAQNITLQVQRTAQTAQNCQCYYSIMYDTLLLIDGQGNANLVR